MLQISWNDASNRSVEVPLGDFFCNGFGAPTNVISALIVVGSTGGMNRYVPMPRAFAAGTLPCDIYGAAGTPCVSADSTVQALYSSYDGALYQVTRASNGATSDIGVLSAGGYANAAAQDSFCAGTTCVISKIYDQSPEHNDLTIEGPGTAGDQNHGANAAALPVSIGGGHKAYGINVTQQVGYRHTVGSGVATDGQPEGMYMVAGGMVDNGHESTDICCFDYGTVEATISDTGAGHMDAINFATACIHPCPPAIPTIGARLQIWDCNGVIQQKWSRPRSGVNGDVARLRGGRC